MNPIRAIGTKGKLADRIVADLAANPPPDWSLDRQREYLDWAERVVAGCRGTNAALEARFDDELRSGREKVGI